MKVLKFGGSSVGTADSIRKVLNCILQNSENGAVVLLSAVSGTTDKLIEAVNLSVSNLSQSINIIENLQIYHQNILYKLTNNQTNSYFKIIDSYFDEIYEKINAFNILGEITQQNYDSIVFYGEFLSTAILYIYSRFLKYDFSLIDSRDFIKTNSEFTKASVDFENSSLEFKKNKDIFTQKSIIIAQGFIASDLRGKTSTLGRGGSDYSATVFGLLLKENGINISEIQIWTDVSGIYSADPRIIENAFIIDTITNSEIRILSYLGAKVLHPHTIKPAYLAKIPVRVLNTFKPEESGTLIDMSDNKKQATINSIIQIENCCQIKINNNINNSCFDIEQKLLKLSLQTDLKPLYSSLTENYLLLILQKYSDLIFDIEEHKHIEYLEINCIAIVGYDIMKFINQILEIAKEFNLNFLGNSENCIFLSTKNKLINIEFNNLHNRIFSNN